MQRPHLREIVTEPPSDFTVRMASFVDGLPIDEAVLIPLYEAYRAANDTLLAVNKQPHVQGLAAEIIASESERAADFACAVALKLGQLSSIGDRWRERFIDTMLSHAFFVGGNAADALRAQTAARDLLSLVNPATNQRKAVGRQPMAATLRAQNMLPPNAIAT